VRLIDTHCHLNDAKAFPDVTATIGEARSAGVDRMIVVGIDTESSRQALEIAEAHEGVFAIVGWHPTSAALYTPNDLKEVEAMLSSPKAVAVGEIGLDFYWDKSTPEQQYACLTDQLELAARVGKPVVFHCRDANDELLGFLEGREKLPYLFHCFSGDESHARRALKLGALLGVDGPITYPKNQAQRDLFASLPHDRVVIETDSPYMAPVPFRGKPNRPAWVVHVNTALAECWGVSAEECARITTENAERFFGLTSPRP
jgi:TatD DNase family protein